MLETPKALRILFYFYYLFDLLLGKFLPRERVHPTPRLAQGVTSPSFAGDLSPAKHLISVITEPTSSSSEAAALLIK